MTLFQNFVVVYALLGSFINYTLFIDF